MLPVWNWLPHSINCCASVQHIMPQSLQITCWLWGRCIWLHNTSLSAKPLSWLHWQIMHSMSVTEHIHRWNCLNKLICLLVPPRISTSRRSLFAWHRNMLCLPCKSTLLCICFVNKIANKYLPYSMLWRSSDADFFGSVMLFSATGFMIYRKVVCWITCLLLCKKKGIDFTFLCSKNLSHLNSVTSTPQWTRSRVISMMCVCLDVNMYFVQGSTLTEFTAAETPSPSGSLAYDDSL